jgi:hypothetical protein
MEGKNGSAAAAFERLSTYLLSGAYGDVHTALMPAGRLRPYHIETARSP